MEELWYKKEGAYILLHSISPYPSSLVMCRQAKLLPTTKAKQVSLELKHPLMVDFSEALSCFLA